MIDIDRISPKAHRITAYGEFRQADAVRLVEFARERQASGEEGGHVLIDLVSLAGFSFSAVSEELVHLPLLLKYVYSLDRIAIVSDEDWIRSAARFESALLPGVEYEVYDADEADAARAWIVGESEHPHGGAIRELDRGDDIAAFEIAGRIDRDEAERTIAMARARLVQTECSKLMVVISHWHGFDADAMSSSTVMSGKLDLMNHLDRYAIVGGPSWLRNVASAMGILVTPEIRSFESGQEDEALAWLRG